MKQPLVQKLTSDIAKQIVLNNFLGQVGCVRVYQVQENWHAEELKKSENVHTIHSVQEFRDACDAIDGYDIFVPRNAAITQSQAERVMNTVTKDLNVFWQSSAKK